MNIFLFLVLKEYLCGMNKDVLIRLNGISKAFKAAGEDRAAMQAAQDDFVRSFGPGFIERADAIKNGFEKQCPEVGQSQELRSLEQVAGQMQQMLQFMTPAEPAAPAAAPAQEDNN